MVLRKGKPELCRRSGCGFYRHSKPKILQNHVAELSRAVAGEGEPACRALLGQDVRQAACAEVPGSHGGPSPVLESLNLGGLP